MPSPKEEGTRHAKSSPCQKEEVARVTGQPAGIGDGHKAHRHPHRPKASEACDRSSFEGEPADTTGRHRSLPGTILVPGEDTSAPMPGLPHAC